MDNPELRHGRDPEYPSPVWANPKHCLHPYEYVRLQAANFPPNQPEAAVWRVDCFVCGTSWDQSDSPDWIYDYLTDVIASGRFEAVGGAGNPDIRSKIEWQRQTRYNKMMEGITGSANPIEASNQAISTEDLRAKFDR